MFYTVNWKILARVEIVKIVERSPSKHDLRVEKQGGFVRHFCL